MEADAAEKGAGGKLEAARASGRKVDFSAIKGGAAATKNSRSRHVEGRRHDGSVWRHNGVRVFDGAKGVTEVGIKAEAPSAVEVVHVARGIERVRGECHSR